MLLLSKTKMQAISVNVLRELVLGLFTLDTLLAFLLLCSVFQGAALDDCVSEAPYYGLKACAPSNLYVGILTFKVMIPGGGLLGRD